MPKIMNGWSTYLHPLMREQLADLEWDVSQIIVSNPNNYQSKNKYKRLAVLKKLMAETIPADPSSADYRLGKTFGPTRRAWRRAKFFQQYRLFFRYDSGSRVIVYVWVNDENSKRAYGSKSDCYALFKKMLDRGYPPNDWDSLLAQARES